MNEDADIVELRRWMDENIHGLKADRSTASYALEFIKTQQRNLALLHARMSLQIMMSDCRKIAERIPDAAALALELEKNQCVIPWNEK